MSENVFMSEEFKNKIYFILEHSYKYMIKPEETHRKIMEVMEKEIKDAGDRASSN